MINKLHPTAKKHGFKSNEDFYAVYPTKESYEKALTNEKKFAFGGFKYPNGGNFKSYNPNLAKEDRDFQNWYSKNTLEGQGKIPYSDNLDYDYYSFFKNNGVGDIQNHFPDTYKRPNHPTFSNESIYSTPENPGGTWKGETYNPKGKFQFADGGPKTKTYTNKAEYDKALQAYNDSLNLFKEGVSYYGDVKDLGRTFNSVSATYPPNKAAYETEKIKPVGFNISNKKTDFEQTLYAPIYKKPVVKPEYKSFSMPLMAEAERQAEMRYRPTTTLAKGTLEQEVKPTMAKGTMESEPKPINELMMPSGSYMQKDDFIKRYGEKPWMKATGQKFAFGGFKYQTGGSFYNQSTNQIGSPQVNNTVPSSYTDSFSGNTRSNPSLNLGKSTNFNQSGYTGAATAAATGITKTIADANAAESKQQKDEAIIGGSVDTTRGVVNSLFPIVGVFDTASSIGKGIIDSTNPSETYTTKDGRTISYKEGKEGDHAAAWGASFDPWGNVERSIGSFSGTQENYGQSDVGMGFLDLFAPFVSEGYRNQEARKLVAQSKLNDSLLNAQGVDSTSRNFQAFGGFKYPYGGNMKSEVTGQSYLKDQISDFTKGNYEKHENGGIAVDAQNEVEAGEIVYKDYVFSERLKDANGKSFAQRAKKLIDQIK